MSEVTSEATTITGSEGSQDIAVPPPALEPVAVAPYKFDPYTGAALGFTQPLAPPMPLGVDSSTIVALTNGQPVADAPVDPASISSTQVNDLQALEARLAAIETRLAAFFSKYYRLENFL